MEELNFTSQTTVFFLVENQAFLGVKKICTVVANDLNSVTGSSCTVIDSLEAYNHFTNKKILIICGTLGNSPLIDTLISAKKIDASIIQGKREVYSFSVVDGQFSDSRALVIAGSDKRGTIYGLFHLSELLGVSPWAWWSEVHPVKKENFSLSQKNNFTSNEPSVELRGFFINDEWPAFGQWVNEKFGGFNAKMYEQVFILLLRLKANYLWPAMWTSSFSLDGPGSANEALADEYGIIIGYSHHEPCLRASEEWDKVKGKDSPYGTAWDFHSNAAGLTNYWRDALKRSGKYENTITVGMRGERDSILMATATLQDNINTLKNIITTQNELIAQNVNADLLRTRRVLAVYKEVETYFEGDSSTDGLKKWSGLDGITCMLCDDNFGNLRILPAQDQINRNGGWGMYYHFDYHGGPCSYEWMNSTSLEKTNREMVRAYNAGIKKIWIVNVGDIVGNELPISYFIDLAYDFNRYSPAQEASAYTAQWINDTFGSSLSKSQCETCTQLLHNLSQATSYRKSEALNEDIYHACHFHEAERIFTYANDACLKADGLLQELRADQKKRTQCIDSFIALIYYPVVATLNLVKMHTASSLNKLFSSQSSLYANEFATIIENCIARDDELKQIYYTAADGKWRHFADSAHTGFRTWNNEDWRWPTITHVVPIQGSKMIVSFSDSEQFTNGGFWCGQKQLINDELTNQSIDTIAIDISNGGTVPFAYTLACSADWLSFKEECNAAASLVTTHTRILATVDRARFSGNQSAEIKITGNFGNEAPVTAKLLVIAASNTYPAQQKGSYVESQNYISIPLSGGSSLASPSTCSFVTSSDNSSAGSTRNYIARIYFESTNPSTRGGTLRYRIDINGMQGEVHSAISSKYATDCSSQEWISAVLSNTHIADCKIQIQEGYNKMTVVPLDDGLTVKHAVLFAQDKQPQDSYLPPTTSYCI